VCMNDSKVDVSDISNLNPSEGESFWLGIASKVRGGLETFSALGYESLFNVGGAFPASSPLRCPNVPPLTAMWPVVGGAQCLGPSPVRYPALGQ
jgi:hypothetical protein